VKWRGNRESNNIEDRRGSRGGRGGSGLPMFGGKLSLGTIVIALVAAYFLGINPLTLLGALTGVDSGHSVSQSHTQSLSPEEVEMGRFVSTVLADTEDTWHSIFKQNGQQYREPKLVLFSGSTPTACGTGQTATGPFYCPADQKVYIDLSFYDLMQKRFNVSGDFAQAYVIAHEVGHHVQTLLGISEQVHQAQQRSSEKAANALSVKLELQADCFAGVWAHNADQARGILESGDVEEALHAASAIGDDALQKQSQGYVVPDSFTHGTSAQRARWFRKGLEQGNINACNTFAAKTL
jgi:predicted metalloprotease